MTHGFFQFNNSIINEILNFATSTFDLLFISGPKGSEKSETIQKVIPELSENNLIFQHFCFENSGIDDFLLNFYDALKNFSMNQKISLKKYAGENFKEKMSHYFKTIEKNCIIIIDGFEKVENNAEVIDFISHTASYGNVKVIIISRNPENNIFFTKNISIQSLKTNKVSKDDFKSKMTVLADTVDDELKEKFYDITEGLELYLKMGAKYSSVTSSSVRDLVEEYERRNTLKEITFEEFMVSKFVSLIHSGYLNVFKMICMFSHPLSYNFLENYSIGTKQQISYLLQNLMLSRFADEIYVKDYFKEYVVKTFSIQEKIKYCKEAVKIYECELEKSPKDRLIRLSRETMRKELTRISSMMPAVNSNAKSIFSYAGQNNIWKDEKTREKEKLNEKLNKIRERKKFLTKEQKTLITPKKALFNRNTLEEEENEQKRRFIISLINSSREYAGKYDYKNSSEELKRALEVDDKGEFKIEILSLLAKNSKALNEFEKAKTMYFEALKEAVRTKDIRIGELEFNIALCDKSSFKIDKAKEEFKKIALNESVSANYQARSYVELAELEQADSNLQKASEYYFKALDLSMGKNKDLVCKCYYMLGVLYDENQDTSEAVKYYKKCYLTSSEKNENKYYSAALTNIALIYEESEATLKDAVEYLKMALYFDTENNDTENMYFSQKELAKIYAKIDTMTAIGYFKQALDSAEKLKDDFKVALIYFEAGEFYYDKENDQKALESFLVARKVLNNNTKDENVARIDMRIKDIKVRLDDETFKRITEKYEF